MAAKATKATKSGAEAAAEEPAPRPARETAPAKASAASKTGQSKAVEPATSQPKAVRSRPATAEPSPPKSEPEPEAGDEELVPMNRAERRAKGRGKSASGVPGGRGKVSGGHGPAHTQRNWANRRTG